MKSWLCKHRVGTKVEMDVPRDPSSDPHTRPLSPKPSSTLSPISCRVVIWLVGKIVRIRTRGLFTQLIQIPDGPNNGRRRGLLQGGKTLVSERVRKQDGGTSE